MGLGHVDAKSRPYCPSVFFQVRSAGFDEALGRFGGVIAFGFQRRGAGVSVLFQHVQEGSLCEWIKRLS